MYTCQPIAKLSPKWKLNKGFGTQKKCPFPLNKGVPPKDVTDGIVMSGAHQMGSWLFEHFTGTNFVSPEWWCPLNNTGVPKVPLLTKRVFLSLRLDECYITLDDM